MRSDPALDAGFVLNVHKEVSWTSHDAVTRIRRILNQRAVGHCGSLDPFADGVLVIGVGRGTKLVPHLMGLAKGYRGTLVLGRKTDTGDVAGAVMAEGPVPEARIADLQRIADGFLGPGTQVPPMVSAVKHDGKRLYDLARKGIEVERAPRPIVIHGFRIRAVELPRVDFELECGRGTYVRTLAEDFAAKLGALAFVESLTRTRVGHFDVTDACRLISPPCSERDGLYARAISMAEAVRHLPAAHVDPQWVRKLRQGITPPWNRLRLGAPLEFGQILRLLGPEQELIALAEIEMLPGPADRPIELSSLLRLERVF